MSRYRDEKEARRPANFSSSRSSDSAELMVVEIMLVINEMLWCFDEHKKTGALGYH